MVSGALNQEGDRIWIEGVAPWRPLDMTNSVMASMAVAMGAAGESIGYHHLMGASGSAFRLQFHEHWCPSSPHSHCGYKTVTGAVEALPYELSVYEVDPQDREGVARTKVAVKQSIDGGLPAVYGREEDGLIIGYQNGGEEWVCIHPYRASEGPFIEGEWPWGVAVFKEKRVPAPDARECALRSLRLAVELAETRQVEQYACGFEAWRRWIESLRNDRWFADAAPESLLGVMRGNFWIYRSLTDARRTASSYLKEVSGLFGREPAAHFAKASDVYGDMVEGILARGAVIPPGRLEEGEGWSADSRHAEAEILERAEACEREAVSSLQEGLSLLESGIGGG